MQYTNKYTQKNIDTLKSQIPDADIKYIIILPVLTLRVLGKMQAHDFDTSATTKQYQQLLVPFAAFVDHKFGMIQHM